MIGNNYESWSNIEKSVQKGLDRSSNYIQRRYSTHN